MASFPIPRTEDELYAAFLVLMIIYIAVAYACRLLLGKPIRNGERMYIMAAFNAATFGGSCLILLGILRPAVLTLIGSTKPALMIAGVVGLLYSLHELRSG